MASIGVVIGLCVEYFQKLNGHGGTVVNTGTAEEKGAQGFNVTVL